MLPVYCYLDVNSAYEALLPGAYCANLLDPCMNGYAVRAILANSDGGYAVLDQAQLFTAVTAQIIYNSYNSGYVGPYFARFQLLLVAPADAPADRLERFGRVIRV